MKIYWSIKSIPELADLSEQEQTEVWGKFYRKAWHHWQTWIATLVLCACVALGQAIGMRFGGIHWRILCAVIGCFIGGMILSQIITSVVRTYIREYLNSHEKTN
jgi:biotin transporter BioY